MALQHLLLFGIIEAVVTHCWSFIFSAPTLPAEVGGKSP